MKSKPLGPSVLVLLEWNAMLRNAPSIYRGFLVRNNLVLFLCFCVISIWGVEGVWQDPNILLSRGKSEISPACLVLFCWKILSVWSVCKFCCNLWAVTEMGLTHLLSLLLPATKLHDWFYWLELRICFWATGHWIQIIRSSDVFLVWVILKLFYTVELYWKAGARVTRFTSFLYVSWITWHFDRKRKQSQNSQKIGLGFCEHSVPQDLLSLLSMVKNLYNLWEKS